MNQPTIVLVEDDSNQSELFLASLEQYCALKHRTVPQVETYSSEGSFLDSFQGQAVAADLYIFDLMLRWSEVGEDLGVEKPIDYHADSAGIRCKDAVLSRFPHAKIIIWTAIETDPVILAASKGAKLLEDKLQIDKIMQSLSR